MLCSIATHIDESALQAIKDLEKDLGKSVLAFKCHEVRPARVSGQELDKIKEVEKNLGVSLVAVEF